MLFILSHFFLSFSQAHMSGQWQGAGQAIYLGQNKKCSEISIKFSIPDESTFVTEKLHWKCSGAGLTTKPNRLQISEGQLLYQGHVVGAISGDHILIDTKINGKIFRLSVHKQKDDSIEFSNDVEVLPGQTIQVWGQLNP